MRSVLLGLAGAVALAAPAAQACMMPYTMTVEDHRRADVVVLGTVEAVSPGDSTVTLEISTTRTLQGADRPSWTVEWTPHYAGTSLAEPGTAVIVGLVDRRQIPAMRTGPSDPWSSLTARRMLWTYPFAVIEYYCADTAFFYPATPDEIARVEAMLEGSE